jgi:hypothetical protein
MLRVRLSVRVIGLGLGLGQDLRVTTVAIDKKTDSFVHQSRG